MKKTILFLSLITLTTAVMAQKVSTTSAVISFDASTAKDALPKAGNKTVIASLDKTSGVLMFEAAVNNFSFSNPMMQDHFNSATWMNSATFPKFTFSGKIVKLSEVKFKKDGTYKIKVKGDLTIKGITRSVSIPATIVVKKAVVTASANFTIRLADYGISAQPVESGKVSREPKISVSATF
ncbi:MAG: YceI family protein [Chitinophagaceae bacterium]